MTVFILYLMLQLGATQSENNLTSDEPIITIQNNSDEGGGGDWDDAG